MRTACDRTAPVKMSRHSILYRRRHLVASLVCVLLLAAGASAQEERPQIMPGERRPAANKEVGPRALALLQLGAKGKTSLVPIAILVNGKFWDATEYKAAPVPMALDSGTVYEVEKTGSSQGLFTVNTALHSNSVNAPTPWLGTGEWVPAGSEKARTELKAETVPVGIDTTDGPPRLTRSPPKEAPPATAPSSGTAPATTSSTPASSPAPAPTSTPASAPTTSQPKDASTGTPSTGAGPGTSNSTASPTQTQSKSGDAKPTETGTKTADTRSPDSKPSEPPPTLSDSGAIESDRPRLRRGKSVEPLPDDDVPGYSKPGAQPALTAAKVTQPVDTGPVQLIPAISDAAGPAPRSYAYEWLQGEESQRHDEMMALAKTELRAYLKAEAKEEITPPATGTHSTRRKAAMKAAEPIFENVQLRAYDVWTNNQPVLVLSAQAHMPPGTQTGIDAGLRYSIVLVAHPDIYNNLQKLYVGITDKYHLDVTPRLELIDVVDADGDGRGEFLFRETSDAGSGYVIYRATADTLWKMYDSLNPE